VNKKVNKKYLINSAKKASNSLSLSLSLSRLLTSNKIRDYLTAINPGGFLFQPFMPGQSFPIGFALNPLMAFLRIRRKAIFNINRFKSMALCKVTQSKNLQGGGEYV